MLARPTVIVGISGGVDSAVAALRLRRQGYDVQGLHMTNWDGDDACCTAAQDYHDARRACRELGIALHRVSFAAEYRARVFADFLREYRAGRTPNPDVPCNRLIKFGSFLRHARRLGADRIATGHYARLTTEDPPRLLKGLDPAKDQSYFLHAVDAAALQFTLFPLGDLSKQEVRGLAREAGLPNHDRPDSTGLCFIGEQPFRPFLARHLRGAPGPILTLEGDTIGQHGGLMFHTLGQRSGLGIGGRHGARSQPWYVAAKDPARNALIVVQGRDHPLLWSDHLIAMPPRWIRGRPVDLADSGQLRCLARVRYRHADADCVVQQRADGRLEVRFQRPQWAPAPGQYAVFYAGEECLGGAIIDSVGRQATLSQSANVAAAAPCPIGYNPAPL